jgi:hypothetical protein
LGHQEGDLLRGTLDRSPRGDLANPFGYQFFLSNQRKKLINRR